MARKQRSSTNSEKHHYLKVTFWQENQFWNTGMFSQKSKDYFDGMVQSWIDRERKYTSL